MIALAKDSIVSELEWSLDEEIKLFYSLRNHKPVGVNRHFDMICVHDNFSKLINKDIPSKTIWKRLETLYDMETLHENEDLPFPNEQQEFNLPSEYDKLKEEKLNHKDRSIKKEELSDSENIGNSPVSTNSIKHSKTENSLNTSVNKSISKNKIHETDKKESKNESFKESSIKEIKSEDHKSSAKKRQKLTKDDKDKQPSLNKETNHKKRRSQV